MPVSPHEEVGDEGESEKRAASEASTIKSENVKHECNMLSKY